MCIRDRLAPHGCRSGGGNEWHLGMINQHFADRAAADQDTRQLGRHVTDLRRRALEQRLHRNRGQWRFLGRLPDERVAADKGEGRVPRPDGDRKVEGSDDPGDAERMPGLASWIDLAPSIKRCSAGIGRAVAAVSGVSPGNAMLDCSKASPCPLPTSPKLARWSPTDSTNLGRSRVRERRTPGSVSAKAEWRVSTPGQNYITGPE